MAYRVTPESYESNGRGLGLVTLNTSVLAPVPSVSPLVRSSATVETTTLVGHADDVDALSIVSLLTSNPDVRQWTFESSTDRVTCSWSFHEIAKNNRARVFEGFITAGGQTRQVRLIIATDAALEATVAPVDAICLNGDVLGHCGHFSIEHAFLRVLTAIFCREQKPLVTSKKEVIQHLAA